MDPATHSHALTVVPSPSTALAPAAPASFWDVFKVLPQDVRNEVAALLPLMQEIHAAKKKRPAMQAIALRTNRNVNTLKRWFYAFAAIGPAALVDHHKCGGCGLQGCMRERDVALTEKVIQRWQRDAATNDKRGLSESWRGIIRDLAAGKAVEDAGTWRDVFHQANPFRTPPASCPWSITRPPPGWSLSSFMRHKLPDAVYALIQKGSFNAWPHLPEVRVDLSTLRPFEWLVVDDHRLDFKVFIDVPGRGVQLVELWGLFVMDVATRMIVAFALKPRVEREDETKMAFEHRDMQHLIFHVLSTYGVPEGYNQTWIVENAAAAVSRETEQLVTAVTGGRVLIKRTGIQVGDFTLSGFPEKWGNYRGKRWLEVWFAALDIVLGTVKGQMGSDYWAKPGSFDAREAFGNRLLKLLEKCTPETRAKLALPFEWAQDAHWLIQEGVDLLNHRNDHDLDGFETVRFFAYSETSPPVPLHPQLAILHDCEKDLSAFTAAPMEMQQLWLSRGGRPRRMQPAEKMALEMPRLQKISPAVMVDLLFDEVTRWKNGVLKYRGGGVLDIEMKRGRDKVTVRFEGELPGLDLGQQVIARLNRDHVECGLWVLDEKRRVIGHMTYRGTPRHDDVDALHKELATQIKAKKEAQTQAEKITNPAPIARRRLQEARDLQDVVNTLNAPAAPELPAPQSSTDFAAAVASLSGQSTQPTDRAALRALRKASKS